MHLLLVLETIVLLIAEWETIWVGGVVRRDRRSRGRRGRPLDLLTGGGGVSGVLMMMMLLPAGGGKGVWSGCRKVRGSKRGSGGRSGCGYRVRGGADRRGQR